MLDYERIPPEFEEDFPLKDYSKYVIIQEIFTPNHWLRKIGNEPWKTVDLTPFNGLVPVVFLNSDQWAHRQTLEHPEKAKLLLKADNHEK